MEVQQEVQQVRWHPRQLRPSPRIAQSGITRARPSPPPASIFYSWLISFAWARSAVVVDARVQAAPFYLRFTKWTYFSRDIHPRDKHTPHFFIWSVHVGSGELVFFNGPVKNLQKFPLASPPLHRGQNTSCTEYGQNEIFPWIVTFNVDTVFK